jgi:hypothetical protein
MHLDDTPIKVITEIIVLGKLLKDIVWSKTARRIGASLFKKIKSVPRGIRKPSKKTLPIHIFWLHSLLGNVSSVFSLPSPFLKKAY